MGNTNTSPIYWVKLEFIQKINEEYLHFLPKCIILVSSPWYFYPNVTVPDEYREMLSRSDKQRKWTKWKSWSNIMGNNANIQTWTSMFVCHIINADTVAV